MFSVSRQRLLSWLLRSTGAIELLAFIAVAMPRSWMEVSHARLGLGEMPEGPLLMFMIRQASYAYGMHGVSLWVLAADVHRFGITFSGDALVFGQSETMRQPCAIEHGSAP